MVSRFIYQEIKEGRGIDGKDYVYLDLTHLPRSVIDDKLPDITDFARTYLGIEPKTRAHADSTDRALRDGRLPDRSRRPGACGRRTARPFQASTPRARTPAFPFMERIGWARIRWSIWWCLVVAPAATCWSSTAQSDLPPLPVDPEFVAQARVSRSACEAKGRASRRSSPRAATLMMDQASVVRSAESLTQAKQGIARLRSRYAYAGIDDHGPTFNTDLTEALELGAMLDCAEALVEGALAR